MTKLTAPQRRALDLAAMFTDVACSTNTDENAPSVSTTVADRLVDAGLLTRTRWTGRVWVVRITDAGREALAAWTTAEAPVLAAATWQTNAHLIEDMARLGYLRDTDHVLDPTYGRGVWWQRWRPERLTAHDLDPTKAPNGPMDFTALNYPDGTFDAVTFDPPYMAPGGRKTTSTGDFNDRFGLHTTPARPDSNQVLINDGIAEANRVVRRGGIVLVKCMDYINGGQLWMGTHHTLTHALELGMAVVDRLEHVGRPGPQPTVNLDGSPRRQLHARRNLSTLFVLRRTTPVLPPSLDLDLGGATTK